MTEFIKKRPSFGLTCAGFGFLGGVTTAAHWLHPFFGFIIALGGCLVSWITLRSQSATWKKVESETQIRRRTQRNLIC